MARTTPKKLRDYIMQHVDDDNVIHVELVDRYIEMYTQMRKAERDIRKNGVVVEIVNGSQEYTKVNPSQDVWNAKNKEMNAFFDKQLKTIMKESVRSKEEAVKEVKRASNTVELFRKAAT